MRPKHPLARHLIREEPRGIGNDFTGRCVTLHQLLQRIPRNVRAIDVAAVSAVIPDIDKVIVIQWQNPAGDFNGMLAHPQKRLVPVRITDIPVPSAAWLHLVSAFLGNSLLSEI